MAITNILVILMTTATLCSADLSLPGLKFPDISKLSPGQLFTGLWTCHRYTPINKNDVFSCITVNAEFVNITTVITKIGFVKNGEHILIESTQVMDLLNLFNGKSFAVNQYKYDGSKYTLFCAHKISISLQRNAFVETECQDYGISKWCFSLTKDVPQEIVERCPTSENYLIADNSNCKA